MKSLIKTLSALAVGCALTLSAHAITFNLDGALATQSGSVMGSPHSLFYEVQSDGSDSGSASVLFSSTFGGDDTTGYWVQVAFNGPQPWLTGAGLKAANEMLLWDAADLAPFNAGVFDSITLWQNVITNRNNKYQGISHATLDGTPGTNVPDGGTTATLLGLGLVVMSVIARRRTA